MSFLKSVPFWILGLLILGLLILVHESGHFLFGRLFKFKINEFSVGMGPKLISKEKKGIVYSLRAIPLGGFVAFYGEEAEDCDDPQSLNNKPWWQRAIVMFAGAGFNILFAFLCIGILVCAVGYTAPKLSDISEQSALYSQAQPNDIIYAVNGKTVLNPDHMAEMLAEIPDKESAEFTCLRNGEKYTFTAPRYFDENSQKYIFGITYSYDTVKENIFSSIGYSVKYNVYLTKVTYRFLGQLFTGKADVSQVTGPVSTIGTIGEIIQETAEYDVIPVNQRIREVVVLIINFLGIISMNLAIMNLLPFPALDGFRLVFAIIEGITKKRIPKKAEAIINACGLVVLIGLIIVLEVSKLFT